MIEVKFKMSEFYKPRESVWRTGKSIIEKNISIEWVGVNETDKRSNGQNKGKKGVMKIMVQLQSSAQESMEDKIMKYNRVWSNYEGLRASLMTRKVKNPPAMQETWV